jgi:3'-phosphoadenosine 5'-phosphosulfate sulfotransferase
MTRQEAAQKLRDDAAAIEAVAQRYVAGCAVTFETMHRPLSEVAERMRERAAAYERPA